MSITSNIIQRTFAIRCGESRGTCFTVDIDNSRYLITARHLARGLCNQDEIKIYHNACWKSIGVRLVGNGNGNIDISVLAPDYLFGASNELVVGVNGTEMFEDVYFLGFPFELSGDSANLNAQFPFPLAKKGILSAFQMDDNLLLLDGHNNPGFSGGPVVRSKNPSQVIGVVSGYQSERLPVLDHSGKEGPYTYAMNTGIVCAYDARKINEIVLNNPIGAAAKRTIPNIA